MRAGRVDRIVERPARQAQTVHARADRRRAAQERRSAAVRVLLLRAPDGGGRPGGVRADFPVRRRRRLVHGRLFLHRRHQLREYSTHNRCSWFVMIKVNLMIELIIKGLTDQLFFTNLPIGYHFSFLGRRKKTNRLCKIKLI